MRHPKLSGIVTVLNTPFTDGGAVDLAALQRHAAIAIEAGVAGFLVPAFAGEVLDLSVAERRDMVIAIRDVAQGRAIVVGGASAPSVDERLRNASTLAELGVDIVRSAPYADEAQYVADLSHGRCNGSSLMFRISIRPAAACRLPRSSRPMARSIASATSSSKPWMPA